MIGRGIMSGVQRVYENVRDHGAVTLDQLAAILLGHNMVGRYDKLATLQALTTLEEAGLLQCQRGVWFAS